MIQPRARISTGLHRIGVVLAGPLVLAAIGLAAWEIRPLPECKTLFDNLLPNPDRCQVTQNSVGFNPASQSVPRFTGTPVNHDPFAPAPNFLVASLFLTAGAAVYAACRALGWIINGFVGR